MDRLYLTEQGSSSTAVLVAGDIEIVAMPLGLYGGGNISHIIFPTLIG